ncbi:hypothetical protein OIO90_004038 [Microbotryomycetes sp. JL221]|nr:hypothetical protein OIO90_004038 [Microbotryomycetes sp. JL221]
MGLLERIKIKEENRESRSALLDNDDLRPWPLERRKWSFWSFNLFWFAAVTNVSNFMGGASFLSMGLSFWDGVGCSTGGFAIVAIFMALNGRAGSKWHIGFPAYCRSSFGIFGARVHHFVGMVALCVTQAGGTGGPAITRGGTVTGYERHWLLIRFVLTSAASCSTFASNASDWQRNAIKPSDPILGQIIGFPLSNMIVSIIGLVVASTSEVVVGEIQWNPVIYLDMILERNLDNASIRAGVFFIALGFLYSLLYSSAIENLFPWANDTAALLPRYLNIRRGLYLCILFTIAINPWYLLGSASIFITVLSSYQIFLFSIMAILLVDYYVICKGLFQIEDLYTTRRDGTYYYTYGVNIRAVVAYFVGVAVNFYGFLGNLNVFSVSDATRHSYYFAIFTTTTAAGLTYLALCKIWPVKHFNKEWSEPRGCWEPEQGQPGAGIKYDSEAGSSASVDEKEKEEASGTALPVV